MNFFQHQSESRRASRQLVLLFAAAVIGVVVAVDLVLLTALATTEAQTFTIPTMSWIAQHWTAALVCSLLVLAVIGFASLYKTVSLSDGGGAVARTLGGVRISPDTKDPKQRRLLNVVEEMAIASGVPMPEVYLLEQELGINAFAAGHSPANAAVAVTRGTLETLDRAELQGVIAHEFSHILNGDMRLNIRLMGWVFGLLVIAIIARTILRHTPRDRGDRKGGAGAIVAAAFVILLIGYVGLFFGRLIQAAVSRKRESLADASAVQFTRDPSGLRNALVKIGATSSGSKIVHPEGEEVAHMLFAPGMSRFFATHPDLKERLRAIDPSFDESEFARVQARLAREAQARAPEQASQPSSAERLRDLMAVPVAVTPAAVASLVGNPGTIHIDAAHTIRESLPASLVMASEHPKSAQALLFALALIDDAQGRERQVKFLSQQLGPSLASDIQQLAAEVDALDPLQRMPVLMRSLPTLRQFARPERLHLLATLNGLLQREGRLSLSAYSLRKLAQVHLHDELNHRARSQHLSLQSVENEVVLLFSLLAREGHHEEQAALAAFAAGMTELGFRATLVDVPDAWSAKLDASLQRLDQLQPGAKEQLIRAMVATITHDHALDAREAELLRAVCACLHCPLPPLVA